MNNNKKLDRNRFENELFHLKMNYELEVFNLMKRNKDILSYKELIKLRKFNKKVKVYSILGTVDSKCNSE